MRRSTLFLICIGLILLLGCTNTDEKRERNPREEINFFYNAKSEEETEVPSKAKVYYYGEHYFKE